MTKDRPPLNNIGYGPCNRVRSRMIIFVKKPHILTNEQREEIEEHVRICPVCSDIYQNLKKMSNSAVK